MSAAPPTPPASNNKRALSPGHEEQESNKRPSTTTSSVSKTAADDDRDITSADEPSSADASIKTEVKNESAAASSSVPASAGLPAKMEGDDVDMKDAAGASAAPAAESSIPAAPPASETPQQIQMRCLIVTQDASVIIGKAGKHVNEIREKSGARVTVSESIPGNPERILHVSGALDAVSKAFGLIVRRINDEPFDVASVPGSRAVTIKFIIPNSRMGTVIGKGGSKIKEIQEASGARLNASEAMLPGSTERVLSVSGVADAIHIAVYYIGNILLEYQDRAAPAGSDRSQYRQSSSGGGRDSRDSYGAPRTGGGIGAGAAPAAGSATQSIYIPNDLVGSIIGKAGSKINEIRSQSATQIRIMEPGQPGASNNPDERLVTITGQPAGINMAIQLLYQRLEAEKQARANAI